MQTPGWWSKRTVCLLRIEPKITTTSSLLRKGCQTAAAKGVTSEVAGQREPCIYYGSKPTQAPRIPFRSEVVRRQQRRRRSHPARKQLTPLPTLAPGAACHRAPPSLVSTLHDAARGVPRGKLWGRILPCFSHEVAGFSREVSGFSQDSARVRGTPTLRCRGPR